jgi:Cu/Ag efflux pump CusA
VIGGLLFATIATLFFVPVIFAVIRQGSSSNQTAPAATQEG